ncbi:hypothetical protein H7J50_03675 [Mycobacterium intermedium]|uniref:hypothetical protein n=1 Tax=Mycobacterium intermedium TaxID=28445 RepID=UPI0014763E55|nr:hypothetical protein [Mycobacterium intermedium]MCV6962910.1 hypothetical protein [Mycobacterium intermedium]
MAFLRTHRISRFLKIGRRTPLTPQERTNLYVSRMPIAVFTASLGGHAPDGRFSA